MLRFIVRGFLVGLVLGLGFCGVVFAKTSEREAFLEQQRAVRMRAMVLTFKVNLFVVSASNDYRRRVPS